MSVATQGGTIPITKVILQKYSDLKKQDPPTLGCSKCVSDYLLGIPGMDDIYYMNENLVEMRGGYHVYGFQRYNPKDTKNTRGVFNIAAGEYDKISIGDGHAIANLFMERDFSSANIGGVTVNGNGDINVTAGKNYYKTINSLRSRATTEERYKVIETPFDFHVPSVLQKVLTKMKNDYDLSPGKCIAQGEKITLEPIRGPKTFEAAGGFRSLNYMYSPKFEDGGFIAEHIRTTGREQTVSEIEDRRIFVDYGFDFERSMDLILSMDITNLESNVKEKEEYTYTINRGADYEVHEGGSSRWFQVRCYEPGGRAHVEISANYNSHLFKINDRSNHWIKSHSFHDKGFVWWDDEQFDSDLVSNFPDSEFDIDAKETSILWRELAVDIEHHSWSKYGNHIKAGKHKEYNPPSPKCKAVYMVYPGKEGKVNSVPKLWKMKKGAGVRTTKNVLATANQIVPHHFKLNSADGGKNQNIEISEVLNAETHIYKTSTRTAGKNLFDEQLNTADINKRIITCKAAVNTDLLVLHSDHVAFTPDDEHKGYVEMEDGVYTLNAGNLMKRELLGNQQYFNYEPHIKNKSWKFSKYTNNFEFSQNGFPINAYKILNGTNTYWPGEGVVSNLLSAKYLTNKMVIANGGIGDLEAVSSLNVTYYKPSITGALSGTPLKPLSSNNMFYFTNGINNGNAMSVNSFKVENGTNDKVAYNTATLENGSQNVSGANIVRIDNSGGADPLSLTNTVSINNDNGLASIILSDHYDLTDPNHEPKDVVISEYSMNSIINQSDGDITIQSPTGRFIYDEKYLDAAKLTLKNKRITIDADSLTERLNNANLNIAGYRLKSTIAKTDANSYIVTAGTLKQEGSTIDLNGETMSMMAGSITMNKVYATGEFTGHLEGSMNGTPMVAGFISLPSPLKGTKFETPDCQPTKTQPIAPEAPHQGMQIPKPIANTRSIIGEKTALSILRKMKQFIKKFINIELSLLDVMNGR